MNFCLAAATPAGKTQAADMKSLCLFFLLILGSAASPAHAATLATFRTSVGTMELELFDEHKPITVSNFVKYVTSGRYENLFVHRWVTNFVIQAGGYYVEDPNGTPQFRTVKTFGAITNEYGTGEIYSNTYGTIAMARQSGVVDSATSQWFLNLKDNAFLDSVDEGFTVFGRVLSGTNILNLFVPPPPANGIHYFPQRLQGENQYGEYIFMETNSLPITSLSATYADLVYIDISLRRDLSLSVHQARGRTVVSWESVAAVTNVVEYSASFPPVWQVATHVVGTGEVMTYAEQSAVDPARIYRIGLKY